MMKYIISLSILLIFTSPLHSKEVCRKDVKGMEYFKDQNNQRQWIMRSNYFEVPEKWSAHGTFDHIALPKKKFKDGENLSLTIFLSKPGTKKRLASMKFESHEEYFKSNGESFSSMIHKFKDDFENVHFEIKDKSGNVRCELKLPFAHEAH